LSPFELKSLLTTILSARDHNVADVMLGMSTSSRWRNIQVQSKTGLEVANALKTSTSGIALPNSMTISTQSAGYLAGNFCKIELSHDGVSACPQSIFGRGLNVSIIDPLDGAIIESASFDTHCSSDESDDFAKMIEWLEPGIIVAIVVKVKSSFPPIVFF
jgi:hypothetical protein